MKFILQLICIVSYPQSLGKHFLPQGKLFAPFRAKQLPKLSSLLDTSTITLICIISTNLSHNQTNQKNSIIKGRNKIDPLKAILFIAKKYLKSRQVLHDIFLKLQYKCAEMSRSSISTHFFPVNPSFFRVSQPHPTLALQDQPQGYILSYFYKLLRALFFFLECLLNLLSNLYIPPCVRKIVKFMVFIFLENALILGIFAHAPHHSKLDPSPCHHIGRGKVLIPPGSIFSKICFHNSRKTWRKI